jgi:thiosulfate reductase cytochrome b subunit
MAPLKYKHARLTRWLHWVHFPVLSIMIWSGILIYWANDIYRIGWGEVTVFKFFPTQFYTLLGLDHGLARGIAWHFFFQWFFGVTGCTYFIYTVLSGHWRDLLPTLRSWPDAWNFVLHDLGLKKARTQGPSGHGMKGKHGKNQKYNSAQKIIYSGIIISGFFSILTGLAIYKPVQLQGLTRLFGGYDNARWIHFLLTIGYVLFFVLHLIQVVRAGWNRFLGMVTGYDSE